MIKKSIFVLFFIFSFPLYSATPLTHLIIAEKWYEHLKFSKGEDKTKFYIGTLHPDIRYLAKIPREKTHMADPSVQDVLSNSSPFQAGAILHCLVDKLREEIVVSSGLYAVIEPFANGQSATLLKLIEDQILFERQGALRFLPHFGEICVEQCREGVSETTLFKWHSFLISYLSIGPAEALKTLSYIQWRFLNLSKETIHKWAEIVPELALDTRFQEHVDLLIESLTNKLLQ